MFVAPGWPAKAALQHDITATPGETMIDHISIAVRDLAEGERFYTALLAPLGMTKLREWPDAAIGYGKSYPEFWINRRDAMSKVGDDSGVHICLRARTSAAVDAFHAAALKAGATSDGAPGLRPKYHLSYYAAFVRDPDGNRIEAVTFLPE
jgi:catechol 2,3-dioxygenase-like lactoylglutathione lyase family enzyme